MSHVLGQRVTNSQEQTNSLTPQGYNNLNFWLACDQVVHPETVTNLCASQHKANDFFIVCSIFQLEGNTICLITGQWVLFPSHP